MIRNLLHAWVATLGLPLALTACRERAGTPVMAYRAVPVGSSPERARFTQIRDLAVDSRGVIYVADYSGEISELAPGGQLRRRIGRSGSGPGEFNSLSRLQVIRGDSLFVFDNGLERISLYGPGDSLPAASVQLAQAQLFFPYWAALAPSRRAVVAAYRAAYADNDGRSPGKGRQEVVRVLNLDGSVRRDSVLSFAEAELLTLHGEVEGVAVNPFGRRTVLAMGNQDDFYLAWTGSPEVTVYRADGTRLRTIRAQLGSGERRVTAAERESAVATISNSVLPEAAVRRAVNTAAARSWPLFTDLLLDDHGRIWLGVLGGAGEPVHWTAFDPRGRPTARFDLPGASELRAIRGSRAYLVEKDRDDVPRIVISELRRLDPTAEASR